MTAAQVEDARALAVLADVPGGSADRWLADLRSPSSLLLGATLADHLVGVATALWAGETTDVLLVAVAPEVRRRGIGAALTAGLCRAAFTLGSHRVLLEVRQGNAAAIALYEGLGFTEVARRRSYYRDGEDAVVLQVLPGALP